MVYTIQYQKNGKNSEKNYHVGVKAESVGEAQRIFGRAFPTEKIINISNKV
jgi:hypothetical protein